MRHGSGIARADDKQTAHEVLRSIRQIVRKITEHSRHLARAAGVTLPQIMCLKAIGELEEAGEKEITVAMIGHSVHLSPATVSRIIERLLRAGFVDRQRGLRDRRRVCLSLTAAGLERYQSLPTPLQESFLDRLMDLDPAERVQLLDALRRITELMEADDLDAAPILTPGEDVKAD